MNTYTKTISPQEAQRLLDHDHVNNRHISSSTVRHYARQMEEGLWNEDNPQPIILTRDGLLLRDLDAGYGCVTRIKEDKT